MLRNLVEVAEADAPARIAAVYQDIRDVLGTSFVNLVYRHLATDVASLEWSWSAIRPHLVAGSLTAQASQLRQAVAARCEGWAGVADATPPHPDPASVAAISRLVASYNHANAVNLMALSHVLRNPPSERSAIAAATTPGAAPPATPSDEGEPLPPLPALERLADDERRRIERLNRYAEPGDPAIVASLYRHLAAWPGALDFAERILLPLEHDGLLAQGRAFTAGEAARVAVLHSLAMPPPPAGFESRFGASLRQLRDVTISKMLPIGQALSHALASIPSR